MTAIDTHRRDILDILADPQGQPWRTYQLAMRLRLPTRRVLTMMKRIAHDGVVVKDERLSYEHDFSWRITPEGRQEHATNHGREP